MTAGGLSLRVSLLNNKCFGSGVATFVAVPVRKNWQENNLNVFRFRISKAFNSKLSCHMRSQS